MRVFKNKNDLTILKFIIYQYIFPESEEEKERERKTLFFLKAGKSGRKKMNRLQLFQFFQ